MILTNNMGAANYSYSLLKNLIESIVLDIEVGDVVLGGRFKNKRTIVKKIGEDELGQPTINGKTILKFRIEKTLPFEHKSKKTKEEKKKSLKEELENPSFQRYHEIRKSNLALFKALARRAKLFAKAIKKNISIEKLAKFLSILIENEKEQETSVYELITTKDVFAFLDASLTKEEERMKAKKLYMEAMEMLKEE